MSKHRIVKSDFWVDEYVENLPINERYFFLYLLTNPESNILGIYKNTLKRMSFETDLSQPEIEEILNHFSKDDKVHFIDNHIIMVNFQKHQHPSGTMRTGIAKLIDNLPKPVIDFILLKKSMVYDRLYIGYLIDYVYPYKDKDKNKDKNKSKKSHLFSESQSPDEFILSLPKTFNERNSDINLQSVLEDVLLYEKKTGKPYQDHCAAMETFIKRDRSDKKTYLKNNNPKDNGMSSAQREIQKTQEYLNQ